MGFLETNDLAYAPSFRARVKVGIVKYAGVVLTEAKGSMTDAHYDKRTAYARDVLRDPESVVSSFIWPVLSNATIANEGLDTTDSSIEYQIGQVWDNLAGVTSADKTVQA